MRGTVDTSSLESTAPDAAVDDCDAAAQHSESSRLARHPLAGCLGDAGRSGVSAPRLPPAFDFAIGAAFAGVDFCDAGSDGLDGAKDDDRGAGEDEEDEDEAVRAGESDITSAGGRRPSLVLPEAAARCAFDARGPAPSDIGRVCGGGKGARGRRRCERSKSETTHAALADRLARRGPWLPAVGVDCNECSRHLNASVRNSCLDADD